MHEEVLEMVKDKQVVWLLDAIGLQIKIIQALAKHDMMEFGELTVQDQQRLEPTKNGDKEVFVQKVCMPGRIHTHMYASIGLLHNAMTGSWSIDVKSVHQRRTRHGVAVICWRRNFYMAIFACGNVVQGQSSHAFWWLTLLSWWATIRCGELIFVWGFCPLWSRCSLLFGWLSPLDFQ